MVGPDYAPPVAPIAPAWLEETTATAVADGHDADAQLATWWTVFDDPVLDRLIADALAQNLTLRAAGLRVVEARARRGIAVGEFFPQTQKVGGDIGATRISDNSAASTSDNSYAFNDAFFTAAWELDFWGKFRRGIESADAELLATIADYDAIVVSLLADVATDYVLVRSLQERVGYARANVQLQSETLALTELRFRGGAVSELDVATARSTLASTQALVPQFEDGLRQATMALCVLLGRTPSDLAAELGGVGPIPTPPPSIALGVPADLLRRRPDVRRAERIAAAASAEIGVAEADFYPAVTLAGSTGFASSDAMVMGRTPGLNNIFDASSFQGFIGLNVSMPILNYGRIANNVRAKAALFEQAAVDYQNTVLRAAADVESSLSSFLRNRQRAEFLADGVKASRRSVELSVLQYGAGATDFIRVDQAQSALALQQDALALARALAALGCVNTFRALGGGWTSVGSGAPNQSFVPPETVRELKSLTGWGDLLDGDTATRDAKP